MVTRSVALYDFLPLPASSPPSHLLPPSPLPPPLPPPLSPPLPPPYPPPLPPPSLLLLFHQLLWALYLLPLITVGVTQS